MYELLGLIESAPPYDGNLLLHTNPNWIRSYDEKRAKYILISDREPFSNWGLEQAPCAPGTGRAFGMTKLWFGGSANELFELFIHSVENSSRNNGCIDELCIHTNQRHAYEQLFNLQMDHTPIDAETNNEISNILKIASENMIRRQTLAANAQGALGGYADSNTQSITDKAVKPLLTASLRKQIASHIRENKEPLTPIWNPEGKKGIIGYGRGHKRDVIYEH